MAKARNQWQPLRQSTFIFDDFSDRINLLCKLAAYGDRPHQNWWFGANWGYDWEWPNV